MTRPVDSDDDPAALSARWCARLAEVLDDVGRRLGLLGAGLGTDWPDGNGREWADRATHTGSALGRESAAAAELGSAYARLAAGADGTVGAFAGRRPGMRLPGTDTSRVTDETGMRIAELDPPLPD